MILGDGDQIGAQIRQWRVNLGLTVAEACRMSGVSPTVWGRIESGDTPNPIHRTIMRMLKGMGAVIEAKFASSDQQLDLEPQRLPLRVPKPRKADGRIHADA